MNTFLTLLTVKVNWSGLDFLGRTSLFGKEIVNKMHLNYIFFLMLELEKTKCMFQVEDFYSLDNDCFLTSLESLETVREQKRNFVNCEDFGEFDS